MLEFDADSHSYSVRGKRVPGVTSLLDSLHSFAGVPMSVLDAAKERGTAVHLACQLDDLSDLDEDGLDSAWQGYLDAWREFRAARAPAWSVIEKAMFHSVHRYAGTPDRFGLFGGDHWVVDIKTSAAAHPVWGIQTAAYRALIDANGHTGDLIRRATVQLRADGTFRFHEWTDPTDWPAFVSLLTLSQWKAKHEH